MANGKVLVVDDDLALASFVTEALTDWGYQVVVTTGAQTLRVAPTLRPDVILLDIMMPGMDGFEVSQRLRADPATAAIPQIAMSADQAKIYSLLMPVNDVLCKPFALDDLEQIIAHWVAPPVDQ